MGLVDAYLQLGLAASALLILRVLLLPLLAYNMRWSFRGFVELLKGRSYPTSLYETVVFMFSGACMGYSALTLLGREVSAWSLPWSLAFQCMILVAAIAAFIGNKVAATVKFERFYWLFASNNLDVAVRMAEMNVADPEFAEGALATAEATLALKLAKEALNGEPD